MFRSLVKKRSFALSFAMAAVTMFTVNTANAGSWRDRAAQKFSNYMSQRPTMDDGWNAGRNAMQSGRAIINNSPLGFGYNGGQVLIDTMRATGWAGNDIGTMYQNQYYGRNVWGW